MKMNFVKLQKSTIQKKIILITLTCSLVFLCIAPAYANSNTGAYDFNIYQNTNTLVTNSSSTNSFVSNIYTLLSQFKTNFDAYYSSWNTSTFLPNSLLNNINSTITTLNNNVVSNSHDYSSTLTNIYNSLVAINADTYNIDANIDNIYTWVMAIGQSLNNVDTNLSTFITANHNDLTSVKSSIDNFKSANHTDISSFANSNHNDITEFQNDYNNINWVNGGTFKGFKSSVTGEYISSNGNYSEIYAISSVLDGSIYEFHVPVALQGLADPEYKIDFGYIYNNRFYPLECSIISTTSSNYFTSFIIYMPVTNRNNSNFDMAIHIYDSNVTWSVYTGFASSTYIKMLNVGSEDFYKVASFDIEYNLLDLFRQAKNMFFDDETLEAKKANESQTTTVINNYTGSGKASASASDFSDIANSVDSINSGLNTGVSLSNILNIFNNTDGYSFWSAETRNELNSTNSNRLMKGSNDTDTPLYDAKLNELFSYMGVDKK